MKLTKAQVMDLDDVTVPAGTHGVLVDFCVGGMCYVEVFEPYDDVVLVAVADLLPD